MGGRRSPGQCRRTRDWRRGFDIVGTIPDDKERDRGIVRVLQTLRTHPPQGNRTAAFEAGAAGAETIRRPSDRHEAFEALLDALRAAPTDESKVAAQVTVDLSHGERETFLKLLPSLIHLICKNRPGLSVRIADELTRIEELLSA